MTFRCLDDADVKGKRVLLRVDLNVPMQDGKVADATRIEEIAPTITEIADKGGKVILLSHFGRPKNGPDPKYSLRPVVPEVARIVQAPGRVRRGLHRAERAGGHRQDARRRHSVPRKHPLPSGRGEKRQGLRQGTRRARRYLRRRRLLRRAPRARRQQRDRDGVRHAGLSRPRHARRARGAAPRVRDAGASGRRDRRRRQDFDQARTPRPSPG